LVTKEEFVHHLVRECGYLKPDAESIEGVLDEDGGISELQWLQFLKWLNPTPEDSGNAAQLINSAVSLHFISSYSFSSHSFLFFLLCLCSSFSLSL
jgi:hypothetical protein